MGNVALTLIRAIPVAPASWGWHLWQAPALAKWRPGQWIQGQWTGLKTNWHREQWHMTSRSGCAYEPLLGSIKGALKRCDQLTEQVTQSSHEAIRNANFVTRQRAPHDAFEAFFFTQHLRWLDVVEVRFGASSDGGVWADAYSFSAGVCPASGFLALFVSILLFWIPFGDFGQNKIHLRTLRTLVEELPDVTVEVRSSSEDTNASSRLALR